MRFQRTVELSIPRSSTKSQCNRIRQTFHHPRQPTPHTFRSSHPQATSHSDPRRRTESGVLGGSLSCCRSRSASEGPTHVGDWVHVGDWAHVGEWAYIGDWAECTRTKLGSLLIAGKDLLRRVNIRAPASLTGDSPNPSGCCQSVMIPWKGGNGRMSDERCQR
jgi:hypothetical protein